MAHASAPKRPAKDGIPETIAIPEAMLTPILDGERQKAAIDTSVASLVNAFLLGHGVTPGEFRWNIDTDRKVMTRGPRLAAAPAPVPAAAAPAAIVPIAPRRERRAAART